MERNLLIFAAALLLCACGTYYPRQKAVWNKEWNDFAATIEQNEKMDLFEKSKAVLGKLSELNERYPIDSLF